LQSVTVSGAWAIWNRTAPQWHVASIMVSRLSEIFIHFVQVGV
jgi:hypothetical protein